VIASFSQYSRSPGSSTSQAATNVVGVGEWRPPIGAGGAGGGGAGLALIPLAAAAFVLFLVVRP
jgi:hypothetical protein